MSATRLCLSMIVKDEAHVVARCLASVKPLLAHWIVVDTGSSDGTPEIVTRALEGVPGTVHRRPWVDFAHNRSEALELARPHGDYALVIDADDELVVPAGFVLPALTEEAYSLRIEFGAMTYWRVQLLGSRAPWRYEGVLHEYPECGRPATQARLEGPFIRIHKEGARSKDADRWRKDAAVLEAALAKEPENARYWFYLAQSWRDAGEHDKSIAAYERRAELGGWAEEVFYALYQRAVVMERAGRPREAVHAAYLRAWHARPSRAEPLCELARYCRLGGEHALSHLFGGRAAAIPRPDDVLFVDDTVYGWRALDEASLGAYYTQRFDECAALCVRLLTEERLPERERERVRKNLDFAASQKVPRRP